MLNLVLYKLLTSKHVHHLPQSGQNIDLMASMVNEERDIHPKPVHHTLQVEELTFM